ncbi:hypothetical protein [Labedaea rhizosphaerae]|uniref:hypothetical protein n=1 Tax=Labedaea rhizosphaerae TaxID=598644 RepID=UPI00105EBCF2|nr:hypothetical protein [Labedaea rhizosphaerae]
MQFAHEVVGERPPDAGVGEGDQFVPDDLRDQAFQGAKVIDPEAIAVLRARGLPDHETAVEIPAALLDFVPPPSGRA